jgi:hypothetical protein
MQRVLDPVAPAGADKSGPTFRPLDTLAGKVVGFIDNSKPNFDHLVADLTKILVEKHCVKSVVTHRKLAAAMPASDAMLEDVRQRCDLVIAGCGD